jgi:hypothetical protein
MKKYGKWSIFVLIGIFVLGIFVFLYMRLFGENDKVTSQQLTPEQKLIVDTEFNTPEEIKLEDIDTREEIYVMMHEMANTKIIAVDGMIWGLQPMTKNRIVALQKAAKDLGIEDERIYEILDRWKNQDFSQCVDDHNYVWKKYLNGEVGKAKALRQ